MCLFISLSILYEDRNHLQNSDNFMTMLNTSSLPLTYRKESYGDYVDYWFYEDYFNNLTSVYYYNYWSPENYFNDGYKSKNFKIFLPFIVLFCIFGLVGNGCVIRLLGFRIKRNPFTTYVLNLAVADVATIFSSLFAFLYDPFHKSTISIIYIYLFLLFPYNAGLYLLTIISIERCVSVTFPIWYRCHRPHHSSAVVSCFLWVLAGLLSGILILNTLSGQCWMDGIRITIFSLNVFVFTPVMAISTLTLLFKVCHNSWSHRPAKVYTAILITLLFFIIFAIPLSILNFIRVIGANIDVAGIPLSVAVLFAAVNSSINPIIYYLVGRDRKQRFRKSFRSALQRVFMEEAEVHEVDNL
ncbi:mas-related G-protein coupled receptor member H-like [Elgaria multicarinata webbii]|uniref:mas-related G-protein coupled receptor member H-like n=1 Tax=Elgaria multicarinata webbii TaxID=159646 RepID=UPI002FCD4DD4